MHVAWFFDIKIPFQALIETKYPNISHSQQFDIQSTLIIKTNLFADQTRLLLVGGKRIAGESSSVQLVPDDATVSIPEYPHPTATGLTGAWPSDGNGGGVVCGGFESGKNLVTVGSDGVARGVSGNPPGGGQGIMSTCYSLEPVSPASPDSFTWTRIASMKKPRAGELFQCNSSLLCHCHI